MKKSLLFAMIWAGIAFGGSSIGIFLFYVPQGKALHCGGDSGADGQARLISVSTTIERYRASVYLQDEGEDFVRFCSLTKSQRRRHRLSNATIRDHSIPIVARCGRLGSDGPELYQATVTEIADSKFSLTWPELDGSQSRIELSLSENLETLSLSANLKYDGEGFAPRVMLQEQYQCSTSDISRPNEIMKGLGK